jgi:TonB family protein
MFKRLVKRLLPPALILSLFLHLLILLSVTVMIFAPRVEEQQKSPELYTPAYVYKGGITASSLSSPKPVKMQKEMASNPLPPTSQQKEQLSTSKSTKREVKKSVLSMTYQFLQQNQHAMIAHLKQEQEPIYLVGDSNSPVDPLIRLLARALSAHFDYPREAGMFGIRGRAVISMTLHPNGHLSNVQLLQSADNEDLDAAALYAVNSAPLVKGANKFMSEPKVFVIGFIFR